MPWRGNGPQTVKDLGRQGVGSAWRSLRLLAPEIFPQPSASDLSDRRRRSSATDHGVGPLLPPRTPGRPARRAPPLALRQMRQPLRRMKMETHKSPHWGPVRRHYLHSLSRKNPLSSSFVYTNLLSKSLLPHLEQSAEACAMRANQGATRIQTFVSSASAGRREAPACPKTNWAIQRRLKTRGAINDSVSSTPHVYLQFTTSLELRVEFMISVFSGPVRRSHMWQ
jgi:hypothetical protein